MISKTNKRVLKSIKAVTESIKLINDIEVDKRCKHCGNIIYSPRECSNCRKKFTPTTKFQIFCTRKECCNERMREYVDKCNKKKYGNMNLHSNEN